MINRRWSGSSRSTSSPSWKERRRPSWPGSRPIRCSCGTGWSGIPDQLPLRRIEGTDLWYVVVEIPRDSRVEYQLEVRRGDHWERFNDPLNPRIARSPVGDSSVCYGLGLPGAGLGAARSGRPTGRAGRADDQEPGPAAGQPGHPLPAGAVPDDDPLPVAGGARRGRLPRVRVDEDRAGQPDPPARHGRDRGRLHLPRRSAARVPQLGPARPLDHQGARRPARGAVPADRPSRPGGP